MKKILKIIAILVGLVVFGALCIGGYIWWQLSGGGYTLPSPEPADTVPSETGTTPTSTGTGSITVPKEALTAEQRALAESLGIDADSFVITKEMISCATEKLGEARISEIVGGASPTPLEALRILPCVK